MKKVKNHSQVKRNGEKMFMQMSISLSIYNVVFVGMLSEGLKHVSFVQFLSNALLTSDTYISLVRKKKQKTFFT
jgi:hypothetical protein